MTAPGLDRAIAHADNIVIALVIAAGMTGVAIAAVIVGIVVLWRSR